MHRRFSSTQPLVCRLRQGAAHRGNAHAEGIVGTVVVANTTKMFLYGESGMVVQMPLFRGLATLYAFGAAARLGCFGVESSLIVKS